MADPALNAADDQSDGLADAWFWGAIAVAVLLRLIPLLVVGWETDCQRDECIYSGMAERIVQGQGLTVARKGWLPAPGYPYLLAACQVAFGTQSAIKWLQVGASTVTIWLMYRIGWRVAGGRRPARLAAWAMALHPTFIFYVGTLWTETLYAFLLMCSVLAVLWSRDDGAPTWSGALAGFFLGACVLFRGVATYLGPVYLFAMVWPEWRTRWRHGLAMLAAMVLTVAPYSIHASIRHGGFMVSDTTLGHVIYLGNNVFEPVTFDYGNGQLTTQIYSHTLRSGRRPCQRKRIKPVPSSRCEVKRALAFIGRHPGLFVKRMPLRVAQLLNPHSFATRHIRWGYWYPIASPWWVEELWVLWIAGSSIAITLIGTVGAFARARSTWGIVAVGTIAYHLVVIASLYGMTRFRLPLEPFWMIFMVWAVHDPRGTVAALQASRIRLVGLLAALPVLVWLMAWFFPTGFPGWW